MELSKKTRRGRSSKLDKTPNVVKGRGSLDSFTKQMKKNKSDGEESDIGAEKEEEMDRITAILIGIFDETKDLKNEMKDGDRK